MKLLVDLQGRPLTNSFQSPSLIHPHMMRSEVPKHLSRPNHHAGHRIALPSLFTIFTSLSLVLWLTALLVAFGRLYPQLIAGEVTVPMAAVQQIGPHANYKLSATLPAKKENRSPPPLTYASASATFDGRTLRPIGTMRMLVTAYSPDRRSCGKWADGVTASGHSVWTNAMKLVAADTRLLPFGTILTVPGYNDSKPVQVLDRGGRIKGHRLDLLYPTHEIARRWGKQFIDVTIWEYAG